MSDALPDHPLAESLVSGFLHVTGIGSRLAKRDADEEQLDALDETMLTDLDREFHERGEDAVPGLDLATVTKVDPDFTPDAFLLIARDAFRVLQDAHTEGAPALDADIASAEVTAASVVDGRERAVVRFGINGGPSATQDWTFERDPSVDSSDDDEDHEVADGGWMVAHRGWRLTGIAAAA
jgi:predicted lipid-binding transport protein (Tim44 family)